MPARHSRGEANAQNRLGPPGGAAAPGELRLRSRHRTNSDVILNLNTRFLTRGVWGPPRPRETPARAHGRGRHQVPRAAVRVQRRGPWACPAQPGVWGGRRAGVQPADSTSGAHPGVLTGGLERRFAHPCAQWPIPAAKRWERPACPSVGDG